MEKEKIKRKDLRCSLLKRVIIRADISAMVKLEDSVLSVSRQDWFKGLFESMDKFTAAVNPSIPDKTSLVSETHGAEVRRFFDCTIQPKQELTLDISDEFVCLDIKCNGQYESLDPYISLMANVIGQVIHDDDYVKLKRLAIRKIDGLVLTNANEANRIFEYFDQGIMAKGEGMRKRLYNDYFYSNTNKVGVNYSRQVKIGDTAANRFVFTMDTDVFVRPNDLENLRPGVEELKQILSERINETAFDVFKRGVKEDFLNENLKKDGE